MTYKNFKYEIKKLGLNVHIFNTLIFVKNDYRAVYYVDTKKRYYINREYEFSNLDEILQGKVFELVLNLAKTPLDERGDLYHEDKWYLKHKYLNVWKGENYLRIDMERKDLSLGSKKADGIIWISKFTKYDLDQLANRININEFEKEKVE
jgi:hypothetical protein